ncbi:MAG: hypothetical protein NTW87_24255, partial [Planctomycetota bacterium]|nr:hypothetical protein [Planctomycetota bacterium]
TVRYGPRPIPSFPDGRRLLKGDSRNEELAVLALDGAVLARLLPPPSDGSGARLGAAIMSRDGDRLAAPYRGNLLLWRRVRPEWWWGVAWLPAFWVMVAFASAFLWSVWEERRLGAALSGVDSGKQDRHLQP